MRENQSGDAFDLSRKGFESWPYMFGLMYSRIFEASLQGGIMSAVPQVQMLATWCKPFMKAEDWESIQQARQENESLEWWHIHAIMEKCLEVAQEKGAWEFRRDALEESYLEVK